MLQALVAAAALFLASCGTSDDLTTRHVSQIEAQIRMPDGAAGIEEYGRFYSSDGTRIHGEFVARGMVTDLLEHRTVRQRIGANIYIVDQYNMPGVMDGGCGVLTLTYDTSDSSMVGPFCNGEG